MLQYLMTAAIAICAIVGIGLAYNWFEQARTRKRERARNEILAYLGMSWNDYDDPELKIAQRAKRISDLLVEEAHGRAHRGTYLANRLLQAGAITEAKRNEVVAFFRPYLTETDRKGALPARLPDMAIESHRDRDAYWIEQQWQTFAEDYAVLRRLLTHTFLIAYPFADSVPEQVWDRG